LTSRQKSAKIECGPSTVSLPGVAVAQRLTSYDSPFALHPQDPSEL
jgi:hypothetical protein